MSSVTLPVSQNTFVASTQEYNNYSMYPVLYCGTDEVYGTCLSLLKFDFTTIPAGSVDKAELELSVIVKAEKETASTITINRIAEHFDALTVTYASRPAIVETTSQVQVTTENLYKTVQIDITPLVNDWLSGTHVNHGLALVNSVDNTLVQFGSDKIVWEPYFPKLNLEYSTPPVEPSGCYGYVYHTNSDTVHVKDAVFFNQNGYLSGVAHTPDTEELVIEADGMYAVWFTSASQTECQIALYQNSQVVPGSIYSVGANSTGNNFMALINAKAGDQLTVRNHSGHIAAMLDNSTGGIEETVSASVFVLKIGPRAKPAAILEAINSALTTDTIRIALNNPVLGLKLYEFNSLDANLQKFVLEDMLLMRPPTGYAVAADVQAQLNESIADYSVNSLNIYVAAGAQNGSGTKAHPFGIIEEALGLAQPGGTIHLSGTFTNWGSINLTIPGISLVGDGNTQIIVDSDSIPLLVNAPDIKLVSLILINKIYSPIEMIRVMSFGTVITKCVITGRGKADQLQQLDGISVLESGTQEFDIRNNQIDSVNVGIRLMNSQLGYVCDNNISNTISGILIDKGIAEITGNSWLGDINEADIRIANNTQLDPLIDAPTLSIRNNNAQTIDEREQQI